MLGKRSCNERQGRRRGGRRDSTTENGGEFGVCVEDGSTEREGRERWRLRRRGLKKMEHILGGLLEIQFGGKAWNGDFFGEKIDRENVTCGIGVGEVALPAPVVFEGRPDIPTDLTVLSEGGASVMR
jgi:hypothetical protein